MVSYCQYCCHSYENQESDAVEPHRFCSNMCEVDDQEEEDNVCQQCFEYYQGDAADGFCSDFCADEYDRQLGGEDE